MRDGLNSIGREELAALGERTLEELVAQPPHHLSPEEWYSIGMTSGSSGGRPVVICVQHPAHETPDLGWPHVGIAFGSRSIRARFIQRSLQESAVRRVLALDGNDLNGGLETLMAEFEPEGFRGFPTLIARAGEYMPPETARGVVGMELFGEKVTPTLLAMFSQKFPACKVKSSYGAAELGFIAVQCEFLPHNCYHPIESVVIEIDAPDENGVGDILISKKIFRDTWLRRYRIGDMGRWEDAPCECGKRYFEFVGRRGLDRIYIAGALLRREEFDRAASQCKDLFEDYRAEAHQKSEGGKLKGSITLTVFAGGRADEALCDEIATRFSMALRLTRTRTLAQLVTDGLFAPLKVELAAQPLPRESKDIKLRQRAA